MWMSEFILVGIYWTSWMYRLIFFIKVDKFLAIIIFQTNFSIPFSLSSPSNSPIMHMFVRLIESHFKKLFFPFVLQVGKSVSTYLLVCYFFLMPVQIYSWAILVIVFTWVTMLSTSDFRFLPSCNWCLLCSTWWGIVTFSPFISLSVVSFGS